MSACRLLLSAAFLQLGASGSRLLMQEPDEGMTLKMIVPGKETSLKMIAPDVENICGDPKIWRSLTQNPTVDGVQNINFMKIDASIEDHLSEKSALIITLEQEIKGLEVLIAEKKEAESAKAMPLEDVTRLITGSLGDFGPDALADAQKTKCGKPIARPRAPRGAYRGSKEAFKKAATEYFTEKIRIDGVEFLEECARLLPPGGEPTESYCAPLCQYFKDTAQGLSDAIAGETAGSSSDDLIKVLKEKKELASAAKTAVSSCKKSQEFIAGLGDQITEQKGKIEERFTEYQVAEENLEDARWNLEDLMEQLDTEQLALKAAETALEKSGVDVSAAEAALKALQEEEASVLAALEELRSLMQVTEEKLLAAKEADNVVVGLKGAVSLVVMKMRLLFTKTVLEPLDKIGLGSSTDMDTYTQEDISENDAAGNLFEKLESLAGFCKGEAKEAFDAVKHHVDLDGLCSFDEPEAVFKELKTTVHKRREWIKAKIEGLQSWINPLKGQSGMTKERVEEFVQIWEPVGLRPIIGVFGSTNIFRHYLKEWELKGKFRRLIAQLKEVISSTDESFANLGSQVGPLQDKLASVIEKRKQAEKDLADLIAQQGLNTEAKEALEETVATMTASAEELDQQNRDLEEELRKAKERWDASKEALLKAHEKATSFLESWTDDEDFGVANAIVEQAEQGLRQTMSVLEEAQASLKAVQMKRAAAQNV